MAKFDGPFAVKSIMRDREWDTATVLREVERCVREGIEMSTADDLADLLGGCSPSTTVDILKRLETMGLIKVVRYQRTRHVYHVGLGAWTKEPENKTPHWRDVLDRSAATPTLPIHKLREVPTVMAEVVRLQQERNLPLAEAQIVLMAYGCQALAQERDMAA